MKNVEIAAFCDIDENILNKRLQEYEKTGKKRPAAYTDLRKLLEDKYIDAISIATPNHCHTLQTDLGMPGGQGRLCGEAVLAQYFRGEADCRGGAQVQPHRAAGQPEPLLEGRCRKPCRRCAMA